MSPINNVCIVGSGFMGSQIGLQCAVHGCHVSMHDVSDSALQRCRGEQAAMLDEQIEGGVVSVQQRQTVLGRIRFTALLNEAADEATAPVDEELLALLTEGDALLYRDVRSQPIRQLTQARPPGAPRPAAFMLLAGTSQAEMRLLVPHVI